MPGQSEETPANQDGGGSTRTPSTTAENGTRSNNTSNNDRSNSRRNNGNRTNGQQSNTRTFKGEVPDVGAVLGISSEQRDMKDRYLHLIEKLVSYVTRESTYENAKDLMPLLLKLEDPMTSLSKKGPTDLTEKDLESYGKKQKYNIELKNHIQREEVLTDNIFKLFSLVWGQLTKALQGRIKKEKEYEDKSTDYDTLWLLGQVKKHSANVDHTDNVFKTAILSLRSLLAIRQGQHESVDDYRRRFEGIFSTLKILGFGDVLKMPTFATDHAKLPAEDSEERLKAMILLLGCDTNRYTNLLTDLDEQMVLGNDNFPTDVGATYDILTRYNLISKKKRGQQRGPGRDRDRPGPRSEDRTTTNHVQFVQQEHSDEVRPGANGQVHPGMPRCYNI